MGGSSDSPVLYRCSRLCHYSLSFTPSPPPSSLLLLPPLPCSLFGQFNHGAMTPPPSPSPFSSRCYSLQGGMALYGVSLTPSFSVPVNPSLSHPIVLCFFSPYFSFCLNPHPPSFRLQPPPIHTKSHHYLASGGGGGFSPRSCPHPPTLPWSYAPESLLHLGSHEQKAHSNQISANYEPIGH